MSGPDLSGYITLLPLDEVADGDAKGFSVERRGEDVQGFVVRQGEQVFAYRNNCPHTGAPLDWMPDRFLDSSAWGGTPRVTFHGHDLMLDPTGGSEGDGLVTGVFADGSAFSVNLRGDNTASHVILVDTSIPDPSTFAAFVGLFGTLGLGCFIRRRHKLPR